MENKKLQKEDLNQVSGGVIKINVGNGEVMYPVYNVGCSLITTVEGLADAVIRQGEGLSTNKWPQNFKNTLVRSIKFQEVFKEIKNNNIQCCDITIKVHNNGNIVDVIIR